MSSYATTADLAKLSLAAAATAGIDPADLQAALDSASDLADGYLRGQYTLPLVAPYSRDLVLKVCDIGAWLALKTRGFNPEDPSDKAVRQGFEDATRWLERIAAGMVHPLVTDSSGSSSPASPLVISNDRRGW